MPIWEVCVCSWCWGERSSHPSWTKDTSTRAVTARGWGRQVSRSCSKVSSTAPWGWVHGPTNGAVPCWGWRPCRLGQHRGSGCLCVRSDCLSWHVPIVQVQVRPRTHSSSPAQVWWPTLRMAFVPGVGWAFRLACFQRRKWVSSTSGTYQSPQFSPRPWNSCICTQSKSSVPLAFDINQPAPQEYPSPWRMVHVSSVTWKGKKHKSSEERNLLWRD